MNILKSLAVLLILTILIFIAIRRVKKCIQKHRTSMLTKSYFKVTVFWVVLCLFGVATIGKYVYPFERKLQPELIAELTVLEQYECKYPGSKFWRGAYESFGLYGESEYFNINEKESFLGFSWPEMDFEKHCYIITYGRTIKTLSYNVWETIDDPFRTGAYVGHMRLNDDFVPDKVYVYEIPKIRIENDINDVQSPWDWG